MVCILSIIKIYSFHLFSLLCQRSSSFWKHRKRCRYFENPYHHAKIADKKTIQFWSVFTATFWFLEKKLSSVLKYLWCLFITKCLNDCIVRVPEYRPWNTVHTMADICLLVQNGNKNTEAKCNVCSNFFLSSIWLS